jgi:microcompartment protein CcmL/EutN
MARSLGVIESHSYASLVNAVDRATKVARVRPARYEKIGEGIVAVVLEGDLANLQLALQAASAAREDGETVITRLITNVGSGVLGILGLPGGGLRF